MSATTPQTGAWTLDTVHSTAGFAVKHMVVSNYRTTFKEIHATVELDGDDVVALTGTVPVASIDIDDENLRAHVLSAEFFDAEHHPEIRFVSTAIKRGEDGSLEVEGELTAKGITRPVTAQGTVARATNPYGQDLLGIELEATIDRSAHDLNWNAPLPSGGFALANDVKLTVHLEFKQA
jgi:polyisoprenoid-binding protein YceI